MTEPSMLHVGQHCALATCKRLDFLPYKCDVCNKVFCEEHFRYSEHGCNSPTKDNQVPVCPICNMPVPVGPNENPNVVMNRHIDSRCKPAAGTGKGTTHMSKNSCGLCGKAELTPIVCKRCGDTFCLAHRFETDHGCAERQKRKRTTRFDLNVDLPKFSMPSSKKSTKYSNTKDTAVGDSRVEQSNRIVVGVMFPTESAVTTHNGAHMFFDRTAKVGKVVDLVAKQARVTNDNNRVPNEQKLKIFRLHGSSKQKLEELDTSMTLEQCGVRNGETLLLERANVVANAQAEASSSNDDGKKDCRIS